MNFTNLVIAALAMSLVAGTASAETLKERIAIGVNGGTTGVGVQGQFKLNPKITLRGGFDSLKFDADVDGDGIVYTGELDFSTTGLFADFHPREGSFFLSGGVYLGARELKVSGRPAAGTSVEVGDEFFTAAEIGTLSSKLDFGSTAPFVGLGWDTTFTTKGRFGLRLLAGAAFGSGADATVVRTGGTTLTAATQARLDQELLDEAKEIEDTVDGYNVFPIIQLGLTYKF
ncbi:MAG TPA: hypothetical protein DIU09_15960 [Hyphomonadaceae bacterium]|jgi:hypothetical protein|nr:hypothetical protein AEM38_11770 [Hyphomonadaceae bacterium UKL13-1]OYU53406.1 MAG: hypothetical protein CFE27_00560 [Alphaproteobacteria bacterium PA1]HCP66068.1 hypothetical protein [Hyphomonadaceae bacterium]